MGEDTKENLPERRAQFLMAGLIIFTAFCLIGILLLVLFNPFRNRLGELDLNKRFDPNQLVPVEQNGRYGFLDLDGQWQVRPEYEKVGNFWGEYAIVNLANASQIINRQGEVQLEAGKNSIFHDDWADTWLVGGVLYNNKFKRQSARNIEVAGGEQGYYSYLSVDSGKSYGIINARGQLVWDCGDGGACTLDLAERLPELDIYAAIKLHSGETQIVNLSRGKLAATYDTNTLVVAGENNFFTLIGTDKSERQIYLADNQVALEGPPGAHYTLADQTGERFFVDFGPFYDKGAYGSQFAYLSLPNRYTFLGAADPWTLEDLTRGYRTFDCGNGVGLKSLDDEVLPCDYASITLPAADLFTWLRQKNGRQIVLTEQAGQFGLYDLGSKSEVATSAMPWRNLDNSPFFVSYLVDSAELLVYNAVSGQETTFSGIKSSSYGAGANYLRLDTDSGTAYYNNRLEKFYQT